MDFAATSAAVTAAGGAGLIEGLSETVINYTLLIGGTILIVAAVVLAARSLLKRNSGDSGGGMKGLFVAAGMVILAGVVMFAVPQLVAGVAGGVAEEGENAGLVDDNNPVNVNPYQ